MIRTQEIVQISGIFLFVSEAFEYVAKLFSNVLESLVVVLTDPYTTMSI